MIKTHLIKFIILICFLQLVSSKSFAQWNIITYKESINNKIEIVSQNKENRLIEFPFPKEGFKNCLSVNQDNKIRSDQYTKIFDSYFWEKKEFSKGFSYKIENVIILNNEKAHLTFNFFCQNINKILIIIHGVNDRYFSKEFSVNNDGYQLPEKSYISNWEFDLSTINKYEGTGKISLKEISVFYLSKEENKNSQLIISSLSVEEFSSHSEGRKLPWLDSLVNNKPEKQIKIFNDYSNWTFNKILVNNKIPTFDDFCIEEGFLSGLVVFDNKDHNDKFQLMLNKLILKAIELYPFYSEKSIDKVAILNEFKTEFVDDTTEKEKYLEKIKTFIDKKYDDPHFELLIPLELREEKNHNVKGPIRVKKIGDSFVIAGIFNDDLKKIPLGSKIVKVDDHKLLQNSKVDELLIRDKSEKINLEIESNNGYDTISRFTIDYNIPVKIPNNFIPKHCDLKINSDSIVYLRINNWQGDVFYTFINNRNIINKSKGLIIDLRGNGGGFGEEVYRTLSLFFDDVNIIGQKDHLWLKESIIVFPELSKFRFRNNLKVVILIDQGTACGSEIFIIGIKKRSFTTVIGDSKSLGAIASPILYRFPSGVILKMHTIYRKYKFDQKIFKEGEGIEPDIWLSKTNYRDLIPYNDKILRFSEKIILR